MTEETKTKFCPNCGKNIDIKAKICLGCGVEQLVTNDHVSNWWYAVAFLGSVIGGLIAWLINKDRDRKKAISFLIVSLIVPGLVLLSTIWSLLMPLFR